MKNVDVSRCANVLDGSVVLTSADNISQQRDGNFNLSSSQPLNLNNEYKNLKNTFNMSEK